MSHGRALRWLVFALLVAVPIGLAPRLLAGETLFWGLPTLQFVPWRQYAFEELAAGRLPAWNPYVGAGAPLIANYQSAVFYPPHWLLLILPVPQALSWIALAHVVWAGLGMWVFAAALGLSEFGRGVSALAFALSGYLLARLSSYPTLDAAAWLPWIVWLVHRSTVRRAPDVVGWLALAVGMQLLAGHAQTAWYTAIGAGLYALWRVGWAQRGAPTRARVGALVTVGGGMAVGVALAAVQLVPTAGYLAESQRSGGLNFAALTNLSYHPLRLVTLFSPHFFGTPADGSYATEGIYFEDAAAIGLVPLLGALAAVIGWLRGRRATAGAETVPFWAALAFAALLVAFGKHAPFFRLLYAHVPTFDLFREPVRWLLLTVFALAALAGVGVEGYWTRGPRTVYASRLAAAGGGGLIALGLAARAWGAPSDLVRTLAWGLAVFGCWLAAASLLTLTQPLAPEVTTARAAPLLWRMTVLTLVALDLGWASSGLNPTLPASFYDSVETERPAGRIYWDHDYEQLVTFGSEDDQSPPVEGYFDVADYRIAQRRSAALRRSRLPNIPLLDRIATLNNNDPLLPHDYADYLDLIEAAGDQAGALLRAAGTTRAYGVTPQSWTGTNPAVAPDADSVTLAWIVRQAVWAPTDEAARSALRDPAWDPLRTVVLSGAPPSAEQAVGPPGVIEVLPGTATERRYRVSTSGPTYVVFSETWYPGWAAEVNGRQAELYRANLAFQAVRVPTGNSDVVLRYTIPHWRLGIAVSAAALLAIALLLAVGGRRLQSA